MGSPLSQASGRSPAIRVFGVNALGTVQGQCPHGLAEGEGQRAGSRLGTPEGDSAGRRHSNRAEGATWLDTLGVLLRLRKGSTPALGKEGAGPFLRTGGRGCGQEAVRLQVSAERWCEHGLPSEGRGLEGLGQRSSPPGAEVRAVVAAGAARRRLTRGQAGRFRGIEILCVATGFCPIRCIHLLKSTVKSCAMDNTQMMPQQQTQADEKRLPGSVRAGRAGPQGRGCVEGERDRASTGVVLAEGKSDAL